MTDRDTSPDTTVPHLREESVTVYAGEDDAALQLPALCYGPWAYLSEHVIATGGRQPAPRRRKSTAPSSRTYHVVHRPSGRPIAAVAGEHAADTLARALYARALTFGSACSLGDTPDDGDEIRAMVGVIADAAPGAIVGGRPARELVAWVTLVQVSDLEVIDDGEAAA